MLADIVAQQAIHIEDLQRRLAAIDGQQAAMHFEDLGPSDGGHLHPAAVNLAE
jgi:hypothetical protein